MQFPYVDYPIKSMWRRSSYQPTAYDDDWEDQPGQGAFYQWGVGIAVPLVILGFGLRAIALQQAAYGRIPMDLRGINAIAYGAAEISAAVFLHCHYFWGNIYNQ